MFRIRKKAKLQEAKPTQQEPPDTAVPRAVGRAVLRELRLIHSWRAELLRIYPLIPADQQQVYESLVNCELRPSFEEVIRLIEGCRVSGLVTDDEASSLRAGQSIEIVFPVSGEDTQGVGG